MRAVVLCAGLGTRLRPYTEKWPKPAMPLLGQPIVAYALGQLQKAGIREIAINTHHLPEQMKRAVVEIADQLNVSIHISHEPDILGTGGALAPMKNFLAGDDFVVFNGDIVTSLDVQELVSAHQQNAALATMALMPMPEGEKFGLVECDASMSVRKISGVGITKETRLSGWHFLGVQVCSKQLLEFLPNTPQQLDILRQLYIPQIEKGKGVKGHVVPSFHAESRKKLFWSDVGTKERYLAAHAQLLDGACDTTQFGMTDPFSKIEKKEKWNFVHPTAVVETTQVVGPSYVGRSAHVEENTKIGTRVSIGNNAHILNGVSVNRCAVLDDARIQAGFYEDDILM